MNWNWVDVLVLCVYGVVSSLWIIFIWKEYDKKLEEGARSQNWSYRTILKSPKWFWEPKKALLGAFAPPFTVGVCLYIFWTHETDIFIILALATISTALFVLMVWISFKDGSIYEPLGKFRKVRGLWLPNHIDD